MKSDRYITLELRAGPAWAPGITVALLRLQLRHMHNLWRMQRAGLIVRARPVTDASGLRGIVVVPREKEDGARAALARDPAVVAGRLVVVHREEKPDSGA